MYVIAVNKPQEFLLHARRLLYNFSRRRRRRLHVDSSYFFDDVVHYDSSVRRWYDCRHLHKQTHTLSIIVQAQNSICAGKIIRFDSMLNYVLPTVQFTLTYTFSLSHRKPAKYIIHNHATMTQLAHQKTALSLSDCFFLEIRSKFSEFEAACILRYSSNRVVIRESKRYRR